VIKTSSLAKIITVFLAFSTKTAFAAPIDLQQAYEKLLAADTTGSNCTLGVTGSGCPIPDISEGGVTIDTTDGFVTLSSPGSTAFLQDITAGTFIVFASTEEVAVDFSFVDLQVQVSNIIYNAANATPPESLTCTVYEDIGSPEDCSVDASPVFVTGYDSIVRLNLSSLEGFAHNFAYNVPVPAALLLFLSGLAGLVGIAGRKGRT
jgi:hypothetical protein